MIVFTEDCDRDLKRKETAASMAGAGKKKEAPASMAGAGKKGEAPASELRVPLAVLYESTAEARPAAAAAAAGDGRKKRKEATATATAEKKRKEDMASESFDLGSLFDEGEVLKLKEEFREVEKLWTDGRCHVEGTLDRWLESKKKAPAAVAKKRKVVRVPLSDAHIQFIKENPLLMIELSDEEMAECPEQYRQVYAIKKLINDKSRAYHQALIDQYQTFGFAYDEREVRDDDEKEEVAVTKN